VELRTPFEDIDMILYSASFKYAVLKNKGSTKREAQREPGAKVIRCIRCMSTMFKEEQTKLAICPLLRPHFGPIACKYSRRSYFLFLISLALYSLCTTTFTVNS
jgi:uncharacterized CHY-type Zn-finger protein